MKKPFKIVDTRVVYDKGMAQLAGSVELADDGSLISTFSEWTDAIVGNVVHVIRSEDQGRSWSDTGIMIKTAREEGGVHVALGMGRLSDGRIILPYADFESGRDSADEHPRLMKNKPRLSEAYIIESNDCGVTWSQPRKLELGYNSVCFYGKIRELGNGRILLPINTAHVETGKNRNRKNHAVGFAISEDGGITWPELIRIFCKGSEKLGETDFIICRDGSYLAVNRTNGELCCTRSADKGDTWSAVSGTGIGGQSPCLHYTSHGRLLLAYRAGDIKDPKNGNKGGLGISWSNDDGYSWEGELILKDPKGYQYKKWHETGMPSIVTLPDGRIFVQFYSYDPDLPYAPSEEPWREIPHIFKRYIAANILEELSE